MDLNKLTVKDLKAKLGARNLPVSGVKAVLVDRLNEAIKKGKAGVAVNPTVVAGSITMRREDVYQMKAQLVHVKAILRKVIKSLEADILQDSQALKEKRSLVEQLNRCRSELESTKEVLLSLIEGQALLKNEPMETVKVKQEPIEAVNLKLFTAVTGEQQKQQPNPQQQQQQPKLQQQQQKLTDANTIDLMIERMNKRRIRRMTSGPLELRN